MFTCFKNVHEFQKTIKIILKCSRIKCKKKENVKKCSMGLACASGGGALAWEQRRTFGTAAVACVGGAMATWTSLSGAAASQDRDLVVRASRDPVWTSLVWRLNNGGWRGVATPVSSRGCRCWLIWFPLSMGGRSLAALRRATSAAAVRRHWGVSDGKVGRRDGRLRRGWASHYRCRGAPIMDASAPPTPPSLGRVLAEEGLAMFEAGRLWPATSVRSYWSGQSQGF